MDNRLCEFRAYIERNRSVDLDSFELFYCLQKPPPHGKRLRVDCAANIPLDDEGKKTHENMGFDSFLCGVEDGLDGDEGFEIPKSPFDSLKGLVVSACLRRSNILLVGDKHPFSVKEFLCLQALFVHGRMQAVGKLKILFESVFEDPLLGRGCGNFLLDNLFEKLPFVFGSVLYQRVEKNEKSPVPHMSLYGFGVHCRERVFPFAFED